LDAREDAGPITAAYDIITGVLGIDEPFDSLEDAASRLAALAVEAEVEPGDPRMVVERLIAKRARARVDRDFETGDRIRDSLAGLGIILEDGADGTTWHRR
jgi:cysteinyl-tRNA synthetase